jgi:hypothetical protein
MRRCILDRNVLATHRDRGFGVFVREGGLWRSDQVPDGLWPTLPAPCSGSIQVLSLQSSDRIATGGFVDPTIDHISAFLGSQVVGVDDPPAGAVIIHAPVGARVLFSRGGTTVGRPMTVVQNGSSQQP